MCDEDELDEEQVSKKLFRFLRLSLLPKEVTDRLSIENNRRLLAKDSCEDLSLFNGKGGLLSHLAEHLIQIVVVVLGCNHLRLTGLHLLDVGEQLGSRHDVVLNHPDQL